MHTIARMLPTVVLALFLAPTIGAQTAATAQGG